MYTQYTNTSKRNQLENSILKSVDQANTIVENDINNRKYKIQGEKDTERIMNPFRFVQFRRKCISFTHLFRDGFCSNLKVTFVYFVEFRVSTKILYTYTPLTLFSEKYENIISSLLGF